MNIKMILLIQSTPGFFTEVPGESIEKSGVLGKETESLYIKDESGWRSLYPGG